eukprot:PRCOL_00001690-RA
MSGASGRVSTLAVVSRAGLPVYTADFAAAPRDEAAHLHEFVMHAALDAVQEQLWSTPACYLRVVDGFRDLLVSAYVTMGHSVLLLLHEGRNEEGIRQFFVEVHEAYLRVMLNPLRKDDDMITNPAFDARVRAAAKKHL